MLPFSRTTPISSSLFLRFPPFLPSSFHSISLPLPLPLLLNPPRSSPFGLLPPSLCIRSIDAVYESKLQAQDFNFKSLKIAIIGFGNFGQFLAKTISRQGHTLLAYSRTNYSDAAKNLGVTFYSNPHDLCETHPEVLILCTSIISSENMLKFFPFHRLKRNILFVDVLSVKEFAKNILLKHLPAEFDILCTHPMFGPDSGKYSLLGLPFVYDKVRIGKQENRIHRCENFLDIFAKEGCRMVEMSCADHDRYTAESLFVTHTMGRVLEKFGLESSPINTKGYETLLNLVDNTARDSFELYYGLFMYNKNAMEQLERLDMAFEAVKKELFWKLHQDFRRQPFATAEGLEERPKKQLLENGAPVEPP
ncbi:hypothetical protein MANES_11G060802v8, partial [Manihot esculenta]